MRLQKAGDWIKYRTEMHNVFYYNEENGSFQWIPPEGNDNTADQDTSLATSEIFTSSEMETVISDTRKDEWKEFVDKESGSIYWFNSMTNVSQWENPFVNSKLSLNQKRSVALNNNRHRRGSDDNDIDNDIEINVVNVYNDEDLHI